MKPRFQKFLFLMAFVAAASPAPAQNGERYGPPVDLVFCLDLSGSTNGLVDRVRNHMWDYVNLFSGTFPKVDFRIGFVGFARPSFGKDNYYVKVISDLSHDIEGLTYELLQLRPQIEKGDQFVGAALKACAQSLSWNERPDAIKVIFLGGNGLVTTGGESYVKAVQACTDKGIIIHCIYLLNNPIMGEQKGWEDIAKRGNGKYTSMQVKFEYYENLGGFDMNKLHSLNQQLNETYLFYGPKGKERWRMQQADDEGIFSANSEGYRYRLEFRISDRYLDKNAEWDLVDLHTRNPASVETVDRDLVPDTMKYMSESDFRATVVFNKYRRKNLITEIREAIAEKDRYIKEKNLDAEKNMKTFDITTIKWLSELLAAHGYTLKN